MTKEASLMKSPISPWIKNLCYFRCFCKKDRAMRMQDRVFERFESLLDICGFVSVQTNLAILISLLMNKD